MTPERLEEIRKRFWNRWQAGAIVFDAGQTKTRKQNLISEDPW